jgi:hypothetical protein
MKNQGHPEARRNRNGLLPERRVIVVQPHISELAYKRIREGGGQEQSRLRMLETLLHASRAAVVALGADMYVIGSKTRRGGGTPRRVGAPWPARPPRRGRTTRCIGRAA